MGLVVVPKFANKHRPDLRTFTNSGIRRAPRTCLWLRFLLENLQLVQLGVDSLRFCPRGIESVILSGSTVRVCRTVLLKSLALQLYL